MGGHGREHSMVIAPVCDAEGALAGTRGRVEEAKRTHGPKIKLMRQADIDLQQQ